jgi:hypothetical protein
MLFVDGADAHWIIDFFGWLEQHIAAFSLLFSLVVTGATVAYVLLTKRLVEETKQLREMETEPHLNVYLTPNAVSPVILDIVIQNSGRIEASNITWEFPRGVENIAEDLRKRDGITVLPELALFRQGIRTLAPSQQIRSAFGPSFGVLADPVLQPIELIASYEYGRNKTGTATFVLSVSELLGMSWISETSPAQSLERIAKVLEQITSTRGAQAWKLLHVVSSSPVDIQRERQELHDRARKQFARPERKLARLLRRLKLKR